MAKDFLWKTPPHAAKKCLTKSKVNDVPRSLGKKQDTEDEEEDDSVDTSRLESTVASESEHSKDDVSEATLESEDDEGSKSESDNDAASEEVEAEEDSESEYKDDVEIVHHIQHIL